MTTPTRSTGLRWWLWGRARSRLDQWVRTLIGDRPFAISFAEGSGSYVNFATRTIVIEPTMPDDFAEVAQRLPTTWGRSRVVRQATLQVLCARALAYHEGGHVLFTGTPPSLGPTHHWLTNALEDERMERLTAQHYPPAGRDFHELGHRLWLGGQTTSDDRATTLLNACLFARWDQDRPSPAPSNLVVPPTDWALWDGQIFPLVQEDWMAPDTERVAALALEILTLIGLPAADDTSRDLMIGTDRLDRGARHAGDDPIPGDDLMPSAGPSTPGDGVDEPETLASSTPDSDPSGGLLWMQPYQTLEVSILGAARRLEKALCVAAPDTDPVVTNRQGRFNTRACVRSQGKTPLLRLAEEADAPEGLALCVLIDGTSSMGGDPGGVAPDGGPLYRDSFNGGRMPAVREAVLLFDRACARLDVPLCIGYARDEGYPTHLGGRRERVMLREPVIWLRRWETPANAEGPRALIAGLYGDANREAISRSLLQAQRELDRRSEAVKVVIYVHDGQPTDEAPDEVRATVDKLRQAKNTVILGLFLGDQAELPRMQAIFGKEWTVGVDDLSHLPVRLGRILAKYRQTK